MIKNIITTLFIFFFLVQFTQAQQKDEQIIKAAMNEQLEAWNNGNIVRFMNTYWHSDSLMFIGKKGVTFGWQKTLENYKSSYPDTTAMGKLDFTILQVNKLSKKYFFVVGKWHLNRSIGNLEGHFTLLFKKIKKQWFIIADHSS